MKTTTKILIAVTAIQILSAMGLVVWLSTTGQSEPERPEYVEEVETTDTEDVVVFDRQQPLSRITVTDDYGESRDIIISDSIITVPAGIIAVPGEDGQLFIFVEEL